MMTKSEEKRFLKRFRKIISDTNRINKETKKFLSDWDESKKKKLRELV